MHIIADLQIHSKYSRAVSKDMVIPEVALWARRKGIGLMATGDWTHPLWFREILANLEETGSGLLKLKQRETSDKRQGSPLFLLATEVSCIYSQGGKGRRIHTLVWVPSIASAEKINKEMTRQGCNLMSDGRPIIGLTSIQVAELVLTIEPKALVFPAHAWTPWFSVFGSMSGFDSLEEAFGPFTKYVYAVETGLSSSPAMNWRIKALDNRSIVSFSDAHSGPKIGREATVFEIPDGKLSYKAIYQAIQSPSGYRSTGDRAERIVNKKSEKLNLKPSQPYPNIAFTIEFHPEEGKYHWSGHRSCNIRWGPEETAKNGTTCPVCGKPLTEGVEQRVSELAGRSEEELKLESGIRKYELWGKQSEIRMTGSRTFPKRPPYVMLVPLQEILSECLGSPVGSPKIQTPYRQLTDALGSEFAVLLSSTHEEIAGIAGERVAVAVKKVRDGDIVVDPGYDGVFGVVRIWRDGEEKPLVDATKEQLSIF
jgi:PHP family Zn ribbon phosphoesterase